MRPEADARDDRCRGKVNDVPRGTVTLLFSDIEKSTSLVKELGEGYSAVLADHRRLLQNAFEHHDGRVIDVQGDSVFVSFPRAHDAVAAAVEAQRALATHAWPDGAKVRVRMGLHTGEPAVEDGHYVGLDVHRAARISAVGHGGQVLVSEATYDLVEQDLPEGERFLDLGVRRLRGLTAPEHLHQLVVDGLPSEFPPLRTGDGRVPRRRRMRALAVAAALAVGIVAVAVVQWTRSDDSTVARINVDAVGVVDAAAGRVDAVAATPVPPGAAAGGEGAIWYLGTLDGTASRIDVRSGSTVQTVDVGTDASGVAVGGGSAWVSSRSDSTVTRIDLETNQIVQVLRVGRAPTGLAYDRGVLWLLDGRRQTLTRVDSATGRVVRVIQLDGVGKGVAAHAGSIWVSHEAAGIVSVVDGRTNARVGEVRVGNGPGALAASEEGVWVANALDATVSHVDPETRAVVATVPVGRGPVGVVAAAGSIWVANELSGTISEIDPVSNTVARTITLGGSPRGIAADGDSVAVSVAAVEGHEGGVLRVHHFELGLDSLDPATAYTIVSWGILSTTGDGLVGFRRVGGPDGATLVPDLAVSLPTPVDDGKTYGFQLRRELRFSNGRELRPSDVRYSLERLFTAGSPRADLYAGIVGGETCLRAPRTCDLSRGVLVDDETGQVTIRLREPDPEFLYKLALPFAYVVPTGTDRTNPGRRPVPSTGPYRVVAGDRLVRLVRNPYFREWSRAARPSAYADEVRISLVGTSPASVGNERAAVVRGSVDVPADVPPGSHDELRILYAGRVHELSLPTTALLMVNTKLPPFDDVDVRRALAFAVDRAEAVRGLAAEPSCQVLPPGFAAYEPYCPYTRDGGTRWKAPDLAAARSLVARSGTSGTPVTVWSTRHGDVRHWADVAADALRRLGYPVSFRFVRESVYWSLIDERRDIQIAPLQWFPDYPTASGFVATLFRCGAFGDYVCDADLDGRMARALSLQQREPRRADAMWASTDRRIVDEALAIPLLSGRGFFFVSERLGNFQHHPVFGVLYDQVWVL
jgi:peptide/nickel transport system substrate-binding protein